MLDNTVSYTITESDTADHFIQMQIADSPPDDWVIGEEINIDEYKGIIRQVNSSVIANSFNTDITIGTKSIFLDTTLSSGIKLNSQDLEGAIRELFGIIGISANIKTIMTIPLPENSQGILETTPINQWLNGITKIKNSQIISAYFDLYGNFNIYPADYTSEFIKLSDLSMFIDSISTDSTIFHNKPEAINTYDPNSPDEQSEPTANVYIRGSGKNKKVIIGKFSEAVRSSSPDAPSKQYLKPTFWGQNVSIVLSGVHDIKLHSKINMDTNGLSGMYTIRRSVITKTPTKITTEIYCSSPKRNAIQIIGKNNV